MFNEKINFLNANCSNIINILCLETEVVIELRRPDFYFIFNHLYLNFNKSFITAAVTYLLKTDISLEFYYIIYI